VRVTRFGGGAREGPAALALSINSPAVVRLTTVRVLGPTPAYVGGTDRIERPTSVPLFVPP
jgi:hypothetical protein